MKVLELLFLFAVVILVKCDHTFIGTNVDRVMVYHHNAEFSSKTFRKRVENVYFIMSEVPSNVGRSIQGILAYDQTQSSATLNVTRGGIGLNFVNLRMKSERGEKLQYDIYIYA